MVANTTPISEAEWGEWLVSIKGGIGGGKIEGAYLHIRNVEFI